MGKIFAGVYYLGIIGGRAYNTTSLYSAMYGKNMQLRILSKVPFFLAHAANLLATQLALEYHDKLLFGKSVEIIAKYDPDVLHFKKYNALFL